MGAKISSMRLVRNNWDKWDGWDEKREGRFSMEVEGWRDGKCDFEDK